MPADGRWDLIRRLKVKDVLISLKYNEPLSMRHEIYYFWETVYMDLTVLSDMFGY
jgi:hypothetical protein